MAFGLTGCGSSSDNFNSVSGQQGSPVGPAPRPDPTPSPIPTGESFIRVAHLAYAPGNVDVLLNGQAVLTNSEQAKATEYIRVNAGAARVQVRATGTATDLLDVTRNVNANSYNTFAIAGTSIAVPVQADSGLVLLALVDDVAPVDDRINLRFAHLVPQEMYSNASLTTAGGGTVLAGPVDFGEATDYEDFTAAAGGRSVEVRGGSDSFTYRFIYSTLRGGTNRNIIETLLEALDGHPDGNVTAFFGYDGPGNFPGFVLIDRAFEASTVYVFNPETVVD